MDGRRSSVELPWVPGMTEAGDCTIGVHYDGPDDRVGKLRIEQADPVVWASIELIDQLRGGDRHPDVEINDDLLTIRASNRTVVYRIGEYDQQRRAYLLTWPD